MKLDDATYEAAKTDVVNTGPRELSFLDLAKVMAEPIGPCVDDLPHVLPADQVEAGQRALGGGVAVCEACGEVVYVPPGWRAER